MIDITVPLSPYAKHAALYRAPLSTPAARRSEHLRGLSLRTRLGLDATRHAGYYVVPPMGSSLPVVRVQCGKMALAMAATCRGMVANAE